jgi:hypothetical protein
MSATKNLDYEHVLNTVRSWSAAVDAGAGGAQNACAGRIARAYHTADTRSSAWAARDWPACAH